MTNDEKRATGSHHHVETDYSNPVKMDFRGIHCSLAAFLALSLIVIAILSIFCK